MNTIHFENPTPEQAELSRRKTMCERHLASLHYLDSSHPLRVHWERERAYANSRLIAISISQTVKENKA